MKLSGEAEIKKALQVKINVERILEEGVEEIMGICGRTAPKDTGALRASFSKGNANNIYKKTRDAIEFGSNLEYALIQEYWEGPHKEGKSPYMKPAINKVFPLMLKDIEEEFARVGLA